MICDFCSGDLGENPTVYNTPDFELYRGPSPGGIIHAESVGGWIACATCAALIDRGDQSALTARATDALSAKYPQLMWSLICARIEPAHIRFFEWLKETKDGG